MSAIAEPAGPRLALVVARARNGVIGKGGALPWRLPADLALFKATTLGKPVLMGRKTWEAIGRPLPGRPNFVLSRDPAFMATGAEVSDDLDDLLTRARARAASDGAAEVCVIGGGEVYRLTLPLADRLYLTEVEAEPEGDASFPAFDEAAFEETKRSTYPSDCQNPFTFTLRVLDRRT